jgi:hypothetical protein
LSASRNASPKAPQMLGARKSRICSKFRSVTLSFPDHGGFTILAIVIVA